ncbi:ketopantoate reductase [Streptomyces sp. SAI-126]|uniref:NAD(P)-binding domain-containing protein n=1 Tax=Streptomyces sp. SAI-126 TaxID=3377732 RepID=UPI003C7E04FD
MRVVVLGCGRVGSALAAQLVNEGHDVRDPRTERLLPITFVVEPGLGSWPSGPV